MKNFGLFLFDKENLSYLESCALMLNIKFGMDYRIGDEYKKDFLLLLDSDRESPSQYKSRQLQESLYDSNEELTEEKKNEIREQIINHKNVEKAPYILWDILLKSNAEIKQYSDKKLEKPLLSVEIINLELADVFKQFEKNHFEFYSSQKGKNLIYPTIDYQVLMNALDYYFFGIKLEEHSTTDYTLNSPLWTAYLIVRDDMLPNFKRQFPDAFENYNKKSSLAREMQNQFSLEKSHADELITQLRALSSTIDVSQK